MNFELENYDNSSMDRSLGMDQSFGKFMNLTLYQLISTLFLGDKSSSDDSQSESQSESLNNSIQPSGSRNLKSIMQKPSKQNSKTTPSNARQVIRVSATHR